MSRGHWLLASVLSSLLVVVPLLLGLFTNEWYVVISYTNSFQLGLKESCQTLTGCGDINYDLLVSYGNGTCDRSPDDVEARNNTTFILVIVTAAISLIQSVVGAVIFGCDIYHLIPRIVHTVLAIATVAVAAAVLAMYAITYQSWLYCDGSYCDEVANENQSCASYFGYSFTFVCCGGGIALLSFITSLISGCGAWAEDQRSLLPVQLSDSSDEDKDIDNPLPPTETEAERAARLALERAEAERRRRMASAPPLPAELQGGDWTWEPDVGYFWSESNSLYFEPQTAQFFDPHSNAWYNPETELWYKPLNEDYDEGNAPDYVS